MRGSGGTPVPQDLVDVCDAFIELYGERHRADYDLNSRVSRPEARRLTTTAEDAIRRLRSLPASIDYTVFLLCCLFGASLQKHQ